MWRKTFSLHGGGRSRNSDRLICLFTINSTQEKYIPNNFQESSLQAYTHFFSVEVKIVEILTDLIKK